MTGTKAFNAFAAGKFWGQKKKKVGIIIGTGLDALNVLLLVLLESDCLSKSLRG